MEALHEKIRYWRRHAGLTQHQLADQIGIKRSRLGAYEEARAQPPAELLVRMARALGIDPQELARRDGQPASRPEPARAKRRPLVSAVPSPRVRPQPAPRTPPPAAPRSPLEWVEDHAAYARQHTDPAYLASLPRLYLPMWPEGVVGRAFAFGDQTLIAASVRDWHALDSQCTYVLVTPQQLHWLAVRNELAQADRLVGVPDGQVVMAADLREVWEVRLCLGSPSQPVSEPLAESVRTLQREVAWLKAQLK